jgi:uncharacterized protein YjdB
MRRLVPLMLLVLATACLPDGGSTASRAYLAVSPDSTKILVGASKKLVATLSDGSAPTLTWESSVPTVATVDATGLVTGRTAGTSTITARTESGLAGTATVVVNESVVVRIIPDTVSVVRGSQTQLTLILTGPIGTQPTIWETTNPSIALVTQSGVLTAISAGVTTVRARNTNVDGIATIIVRPTKVKIRPDGASMVIGQPATFIADITDPAIGAQTDWISTNPIVASVSSAGGVVAAAPGTTWIRATNSNVSDSVLVTVRQPVVTVAPGPLTLTVGQFAQLTVTVANPAINGSTSWSSSNPAVATVGNNGLVTAVAPGVASIAATNSGVTSAVDVTVSAGTLDRVVVCDRSQLSGCAPGTTLVAIGTAVNMRAYAYDANGVDISASCTFGWRVLNGGVIGLTFVADPTNRDALATRVGVGSTSILVSCGSRTGVFTIL